MKKSGGRGSAELRIFFDDEWVESIDVDRSDMLPEMCLPLKQPYLKAFKLMDEQLKLQPKIDCFCSGTTTVTLVKQISLCGNYRWEKNGALFDIYLENSRTRTTQLHLYIYGVSEWDFAIVGTEVARRSGHHSYSPPFPIFSLQSVVNANLLFSRRKRHSGSTVPTTSPSCNQYVEVLSYEVSIRHLKRCCLLN
ncbi:hypothetical protein BRADI_5g17870v3 [Brachypodium distachyon]|uniref:Uncharacterized protein n=1 Tax=Brachypodium distachyon TaxID=15368 RepID=I1J0E6_BRADI|nr:hypothetical protein BRADI_5g17870v3 [Brachypodium distachyon]